MYKGQYIGSIAADTQDKPYRLSLYAIKNRDNTEVWAYTKGYDPELVGEVFADYYNAVLSINKMYNSPVWDFVPGSKAQAILNAPLRKGRGHYGETLGK